jgi:L-amino acid N-acyltransferase YncA
MDSSMHIRFAEVRDAASIAGIYNQGIEERSATFETTPRRPNDMLERVALMERYPTLVMVNDADEVVA